MMVSRLLHLQHVFKSAIKARLLSSGAQPRRIKFGIARGARFYLDRQSDLQREYGLWETESQRIYRRAIRSTDTIYDIGANDGLSALMFARLAHKGQVISFESDAHVSELIRRNVALNPVLERRIHVINAFVCSVDDGESVPPKAGIDTLVRNRHIPPPDFIKIDVDGGELDVLRSMCTTLVTYKPMVFIETHSHLLEQECISFFMALPGFRVRIVKNAFWRRIYPEYRPIDHNRWLLASS